MTLNTGMMRRQREAHPVKANNPSLHLMPSHIFSKAAAVVTIAAHDKDNWYLDFNVLSTTKGHPRTNTTVSQFPNTFPMSQPVLRPKLHTIQNN